MAWRKDVKLGVVRFWVRMVRKVGLQWRAIFGMLIISLPMLLIMGIEHFLLQPRQEVV